MSFRHQRLDGRLWAQNSLFGLRRQKCGVVDRRGRKGTVVRNMADTADPPRSAEAADRSACLPVKPKSGRVLGLGLLVVAGAGFEPATFGL